MKHKALFHSKDKSTNSKSVSCCNLDWHFKGSINMVVNTRSLNMKSSYLVIIVVIV